jgi:putative Ca2+/H+ antiporter (TMEM165/GDT1 family)
MDLKIMLSTFGMIFLAELGDKTQLATFCFAADSQSKLAVFIGSAGALLLSSFLAVACGAIVCRVVPPNYIRTGAGVLFVLLGLWMVLGPGGK